MAMHQVLILIEEAFVWRNKMNMITQWHEYWISIRVLVFKKTQFSML